ncbi:tyrosine-type recombinase/integrase [Acidovorax sp. SUPP1855]|uniref:tyrosine-type recombinase/integrase n=1 Tax=Acidovorax sp. SUPP1855 TaxID=431774 RepID=UPI0023DE384D|nr:tyrosine-type recombinase/integrase [Acidovorax sp. SUPP1855]GKS83250.1 tyrosine-type recombinase/integrase [Acidovorax sp. SUPP1855]
MRTRTKGIQLASDGSRSVDKQYKGSRIFERLGKVTQDEAESWLRQRQADLDAQRINQLRCGDQQLFAAAAQKYLIESERKKLRSLETAAYHVALLLPYVGSMALVDVCNDSLQPFIDERLDEDEVKPSTVNRTLEVARTIMNRAARLWRTDGKPWLATAPLIEMLDEKATRRQPYPITWQQQANVLPRLPVHLQRMVLFALNTGARDANVCRLRWEWERQVPELGRSVFVIPPAEFKTNRTHVLVLNDAAWSVVQECRGMHPEFVFTYRRERVKNHHLAPVMDYKPIATMNNTAFQNARAAAGLERMRVHDLRHTFGQRLRDAGVPEEDRALLLGHAIDGMPQHYATATIARLVEMANKVKETFDRTTLLRVVNG